MVSIGGGRRVRDYRAHLTPSAHELLTCGVVEKRGHEEDQCGSCSYYEKRRAAGTIGIDAQVHEDQG